MEWMKKAKGFEKSVAKPAGGGTLKLVLVNPPQNTKYAQPPMGLATIAAVLVGRGYQATVVDANALRLEPEDIIPYVADADVVGLTAMTPTVNAAVNIARQVKRANPDLLVILGGPHATLLPEETLTAAPEIDAIVRGEGEETVIELLQALQHERPLNDILGITYRKDGEVVSNPARPTNADLDSLPFLAYDLLPWQRYRPHPPHGRAFPFAAIITSRGCPYRCTYCSKPVFGTKFRAQSPQRVLEEIAFHMGSFGAKEIAFYDDVFTLDKKRAYAIADSIMKQGLRIHWTCETRANLVDRELLRHMKQAGCYGVAYGIESASPDMLNDTLGKDITLEQVEEAIRYSQEVGLQTTGYFMLGSPGETPESINKTIQFAKSLQLDFAQFSLTIPFPGTRLYELYLDSRRGETAPWRSFTYSRTDGQVTPVFESDQLSRSDLNYWVRTAYKEFYLRPSYLWQCVRQIRSVGDLRVDIKGLSMLLRSIGSREGLKA